jgi:hypothetical protein
MSKNSRKNKLNKKLSSKKEKYVKFQTGKDDRIQSRLRVPDRIVAQTLINENDTQISQQMRRIPRQKELPDNRKRGI